MNPIPVYGKGAYIWLVSQIEKGDPKKIADKLEKAGVSFVAIKIHNGTFPYSTGAYNVGPTIEELRKRGITVGAWGYVYLNSPQVEARVAVDMCKIHKPAFYLIDAEAHAKGKFNQAAVFANALRAGLPDLPIGLNSYWKPSYHPELPFNELRSICDFDTPQVYWRGANPVGKTILSQKEYGLMKKKLPFWPAGEMFHEAGITTTPKELNEFLSYCRDNFQACVLWSADANETTGALWQAFSDFQWDPAGAKIVRRLHQFFDDAKDYASSHQDEIQKRYESVKSGNHPGWAGPQEMAIGAALIQAVEEGS